MNDEMTMLATVMMPGVAGSVARARRFLRDNLGPGSADLDDMALCVTELVGNGIEHTDSGRGGKIMIALAKSPGAIRIEVTDDGAGGARPCLRSDPEAESGRGLRIVEALAMRWGHRGDGVRTTVWAEFPAVPPHDRHRSYPHFP